ncbi:MAG: hypothetical protein EZS28_002864 [Streblomastix strix]|uniref:Uncharacterized protein n=1 Tax=Streblomastix strix TaxID=222440 RepID=A0A5J4X494_9EUKA|nr:MAG: hypothetical protein EZS28_002864 [Streblomastix strix]
MYSAMSEVLRQASIHPQSFTLSRQEFFDQPVSQMTSDGQRYTRAPLGARGNAACSMSNSQYMLVRIGQIIDLGYIQLMKKDGTRNIAQILFICGYRK